ncbi:CoB--CoM heterodisulfide reductase iron-sulfur subunit B family protein [Desulforamulus aquiferis]|uniref:CoB--CoM heterodisulfide reductase iron-sulfur subunit B family protein n=1 Tax=Desulforamulus aquiferis TaxID=1397668 RepID=A0AAW7ZH00_9FIRM|nr:CoB--CoM heterodisulfide reductase iron-sulfur subunit B family protein [Desulforamulus aquiferis]MDO7788735.1 CoB--CoM heterodisulfide reductase iron-sulfur subunit B family protein [Desulforamulus aquiferis]
MKLAYYPGCSLEATAKEYDSSVRAVCGALDVDLVEIPDWTCCGATSAHATNHRLSVGLPALTVKQIQQMNMDCVVPCSACFNRLKSAEYEMIHNADVRQELEKILNFKFDGKPRVYDLLAAMVDVIGLPTISKKVQKPLKGLKIACYYGCLSVRPGEITGIDSTENPMQMDKLIKALGATPVTWSYKVDCCGAGHSVSKSAMVTNLSGKILAKAREAGADAVVNSCPLCQTNLEMRRPQGEDIPVFFFTELMGLAFGIPEVRNWCSKHLVDSSKLLDSVLAG